MLRCKVCLFVFAVDIVVVVFVVVRFVAVVFVAMYTFVVAFCSCHLCNDCYFCI